MPESVKVAFHSFSEIGNPGTYMAPDESQLLQEKVELSDTSKFNFTQWWKVSDQEILREPFDVRDEVVVALVHALDTVCTFVDFASPITKLVLQQQAGANIRTRIMEGFKKSQELSGEIDRQYRTIYDNMQKDAWELYLEAAHLEDTALE